MSDKVSVIVPVYNVEKYLTRCLESLRVQSYPFFEVLMINDGSDDGSLDICLQYKKIDDRFLLIDKENGGLSSARNCGLKAASGDFVCFVDSDDWVYVDYIKNFVDSIGTADIVISKYVLDDGHSSYTPYDRERIDRIYCNGEIETIIDKLICDYISNRGKLKGTVMPVWKNMYRKSFLDYYNITFVSEREVYYEDYVFNLTAYTKATSIRMLSTAQIVHIIQRNSLSQCFRKGMFEMQKKCYYVVCGIVRESRYSKLIAVCDSKAPEIVSYSLFKECLCPWKEAFGNTQRILKDDFTVSTLKNYPEGIMTNKSKIIYRLAKLDCPVFIVITVKLMMMMEKPYRMLQYIRRNS